MARINGLLLLIGSTHAATDPVNALLTHARAAPTWITSIADTYALERRIEAVEATGPVATEADLLCGRWELLATTQARGAGLLRAMRRDPALGRVDVYQDIRREDRGLRLDNIITATKMGGGRPGRCFRPRQGARSS